MTTRLSPRFVQGPFRSTSSDRSSGRPIASCFAVVLRKSSARRRRRPAMLCRWLELLINCSRTISAKRKTTLMGDQQAEDSRAMVALLDPSCEFHLLLRRQQRNSPDLLQVSAQTGIVFIHKRSVLDGANPPLRRKGGILKYHSRDNPHCLVRGRINSAYCAIFICVLPMTQAVASHTPMVRTTRKRTLPLCICS